MMLKSVGVIPARYGSTRLPGKPLMDINGKAMIWWVYQRARKVPALSMVIVATDHEEIYNYCRANGMDVVMTREGHPTAIHRLYEVSQTVSADFYIQINGDEPLIEPEVICAAVPQKISEDLFGKNVIMPVTNPVEVNDPTNIKMIFDENHLCTYMSRAAIPYPYKAIDYQYYKHIGVIGYSRLMLEFYTKTTPGHLERIEGIDLLRFVDYGKPLYLQEVNAFPSLSVDTVKDLEEVRRRILALHNTAKVKEANK